MEPLIIVENPQRTITLDRNGNYVSFYETRDGEQYQMMLVPGEMDRVVEWWKGASEMTENDTQATTAEATYLLLQGTIGIMCRVFSLMGECLYDQATEELDMGIRRTRDALEAPVITEALQ